MILLTLTIILSIFHLYIFTDAATSIKTYRCVCIKDSLSVSHLNHSSNQSVNFFFSISPITTLMEGMSLVVEAALGGVQFEVPEEVVSFFEVRTASNDFVNHFLKRSNFVFAKGSDDDLVASKRDSLLVDLSETSLVDQIRDGLSSGVTISNIRLDLLKHVEGSSVDSDEGGIIDLSESEESQDLLGLRGKMVNTSNSYNKSNLGFSRDIESTFSSSFSSEINKFLVLGDIFLVKFFTSLKVSLTSGSDSIGSVEDELLATIVELNISGSLLGESLRDVLLRLGFFNFHLV